MDDLLLLILCSPSGAGKSTLTRFLLEKLPELTFSVSHTTRRPRPNEVDGVHYHFVEREVFARMVDAGAFAEWAHVHGNLYGTSTTELERARREGKRVLVFDIDYQGARQIKRIAHPGGRFTSHHPEPAPVRSHYGPQGCTGTTPCPPLPAA